MGTPAPPIEACAAPPKLWHVGTLSYTRAQLFQVFFWMLWGDFCLNFMESVIPTLVPRQLGRLDAPNWLLQLITQGIPAVIAVFMAPTLSVWSDRHRGPRGRRIPFLLWPAPFVTIALLLVGSSTYIAQALHGAFPNVLGKYAVGSVAIGAIAVSIVVYRFFDCFPQTSYYYLWTDVIPGQAMGTFACLFRVCATAGGFLFNWQILKHADDHPIAVYAGAGLLYLLAFVLLAIFVKEGQYPPPPALSEGTRSVRLASAIRMYVRDCYSHAFYWKYYLMCVCFMVGFTSYRGILPVYADKALGMKLENFGNALAARDLVQVAIFLALGPVIDRFHPLRTGLFGCGLMIIAPLASFFFVHDVATFGVSIVICFASTAVYNGATGALGPRILPREKYGQFCSASAIVWQTALIIGPLLSGLMIDLVGDYRYIFLWFAGFATVGMLLMASLLHEWKRLGGDDHYVPPGQEDTRSVQVVAPVDRASRQDGH